MNLECNNCGSFPERAGLLTSDHKAGDQCPCCYLADYDCDGTFVPKLPDVLHLRIDYSVYPGQPLVCAAAIVQLFPNLEAATTIDYDQYGNRLGWYKAESSDSPGAGGQNSYAIDCMRRYLEHQDMDKLIEDLHEMWGRTILHQDCYKDLYEEGMEKARALEPALREILVSWLR